MAQTSNNNIGIFNGGIDTFVKRWKARAFEVLSKVADDVIIFIEGGGTIPVYTGNLQDSTGIGIYIDGVLVKFKPNPIADLPQTHNGKTVYGSTELDRALELGTSEFATGIWIVLFSSVPYALQVQERTNFFSQDVAEDLLKQFLKSEELLR